MAKPKSKPVDLEKMWLVTETVKPISAAALDKLEADFGTEFPPGYRALMRRTGPGAYASELNVWGPDSVRKVTATIHKYDALGPKQGFWNNYARVMKGIAPASLIAVGRSNNGDELVFAKGRPERLLLFPRDHDEITVAGKHLAAALTTFARGGVFDQTYRFDSFDTGLGQVRETWEVAQDDDHGIDQLSQAFVEVARADHDDGDDPPLTFFFRRLQGAITLWDSHQLVEGGRAPLQLIVQRDGVKLKALKAILAAIQGAGFTVKKKSARG